MEKTYNPQDIEQRWYQFWEDEGLFNPDTQGDQVTKTDESYCIMIPPPNVTGSLHMGHAFQDTIMDALIRFHKMRGDSSLWQAGTDHAGIATQMVVERQLAATNVTRHDLGRDEFIKKIWDWKDHSGSTITRQLRRMGASLDWSRERFTMDEGLSHAVNEVFVTLYNEDLIYRGKRLVNWDTKLHTAVSDLEVISEEEDGHMWHMRYPITGEDGYVVVATTRPETLFGDSAVAVCADDERYQHLIGKTITIPLANREIPVIADKHVDSTFGSGCVKITPAHDFNDYEVGQRHDLPILNIFTVDAALNEAVPEAYQGMDRFDARKKVVKDLEALNLLEKIEPHKLMVPRGDRSNTVIEPYLTDQWYVKIEPLAKPAIDAVKNGDIEFVPANWDKTYFEWMNNIQDWCISRQIWWGHRIPAWYDNNGKIYVAKSEAEAREKYNLDDTIELRQDDDVLDTWFSSALWPFSTLGWPEKTPELDKYYPTNVLVTGFDIIFFWVARMIMMGLKFMGEVPFKKVYIHGLVRDALGQKMSKSKGNVLDPIDIIDGIDLETLLDKRSKGLMQPKMAEKIKKDTLKEFPDGIAAFGTDAVRFTFAALATTGRDVRFDLHRVEGYRNFCNKLWNATRYVLMNTEAHKITGTDGELSLAERWIMSRLQTVEKSIIAHMDSFRLDLVAQTLYEFTWNEYCDWYVELSKPILQDENSTPQQLLGTRQTLLSVLETILRLAHPIIPFITEDIWQTIGPMAGKQGNSILLQPFPEPDDSKIDDASTKETQWIQQFILGVRQIRGEMDIKPSKPIPVLLQNGQTEDKQWMENNSLYLKNLAKLESITWLSEGEEAPDSATALIGEMKILIPMAGLIDVEAEKARLEKSMAKVQKDLEKSEKKISNPKFVDKAPEAVVNQEKERIDGFKTSIANLQEQLDKILMLK
ncbi:MAG: valine--tRNA ligase [Methylococcales bacterium]|jgi:valyl-tRNA synthetase|nr:valine--tRNA ligase [Methylococcales bacterium]